MAGERETACEHVVVRGLVQGVGFRWHTRAQARSLGVVGWVRNRRDGAVEVWVQGAPQAVAALVAWLEHGPPGARVDELVRAPQPPAIHADFAIQR
jgi:acylphosphatase